MKAKLNLVIAAAGKGSRSGLNFPKCLYEVEGIPIIIRIIRVALNFTENITIIVSKKGRKKIESCCKKWKVTAEFILQSSQKGMGDAVLAFQNSRYFNKSNDTLLFWGDIPFVKKNTLKALVDLHYKNQCHLSFPTVEVANPYTFVERDVNNNFIKIIETKDRNEKLPDHGERDIGVFLFQQKVVLEFLANPNGSKFGSHRNGEHGFLYVFEFLSRSGFNVFAYNIASKKEAISLNYLSDLEV